VLGIVSLSRKTDRAVGPGPDDGDLRTSDADRSGRHSMSHSVAPTPLIKPLPDVEGAIDALDYQSTGARRNDAAEATPLGVRSLARTPALLWGVLSLTAGSADVISFLGLGGLFNSHITGNLMILAVRVVSGDPAPLALLLSVPVFVVAVFLARVLAVRLQFAGVPPLLPLLVLQLALLTGCLALSVSGGALVVAGDARRVRNGGAERAGAERAGRRAAHRGDDRQCHPICARPG
jgi:Protein of unknown function (DUF1275)